MAKKITLEQFAAFAQKVDTRLDSLEGNRAKGHPMTISASGWTNDSGDANYPYQYKLTVAGVTDASRADAVLDAGSVVTATACGVCAVCKTAANTVIFTSRTAPTGNLTGVLYIAKVAAMSGY